MRRLIYIATASLLSMAGLSRPAAAWEILCVPLPDPAPLGSEACLLSITMADPSGEVVSGTLGMTCRTHQRGFGMRATGALVAGRTPPVPANVVISDNQLFNITLTTPDAAGGLGLVPPGANDVMEALTTATRLAFYGGAGAFESGVVDDPQRAVMEDFLAKCTGQRVSLPDPRERAGSAPGEIPAPSSPGPSRVGPSGPSEPAPASPSSVTPSPVTRSPVTPSPASPAPLEESPAAGASPAPSASPRQTPELIILPAPSPTR